MFFWQVLKTFKLNLNEKLEHKVKRIDSETRSDIKSSAEDKYYAKQFGN